MATHSSVLAWRIPGTGEPGGLPSMGSHRVGHDGCDLEAAAARLKKNKKNLVHINFTFTYIFTISRLCISSHGFELLSGAISFHPEELPVVFLIRRVN